MKKPAPVSRVQLQDPADGKGEFRALGGSSNDDFNNTMATQAIQSLWLSSDEELNERQCQAAVAAMMGIKPRDEIEGWRPRWSRPTTPQWSATGALCTASRPSRAGATT